MKIHNQTSLTLSYADLRSLMEKKTIFQHVGRYKNVDLEVYDINVLSYPFHCALLTRLLSRGSCHLKDSLGRRIPITLSYIFTLLIRFIKDGADGFRIRRRVREDVRSVNKWPAAKLNALSSGSPLYLRSDLNFGIQSGGSLSHMAGVLNNLGSKDGNPIFVTPDPIPNLNPQIEVHIVRPETGFHFFETMEMGFNGVLTSQTRTLTKGRKISFLYQRYSRYNFSGVSLAHDLGVPLILEYNGSEVWMSGRWMRAARYPRLMAEIEDLNLMRADMMVVVSRVLRDELVSRGIPDHKILFVPNGVDVERIHPQIDGSAIREKLRLQSKTVVGFVGTFGLWHGAEVLAAAAGHMLNQNPALRDQIHFLFVGDGQRKLSTEEIVNRNKMNGSCTFTGTVPQNEAPPYMAACDILVAPHVPNPDGTPFFGSPIKLFEYMAMGKPIVASKLNQIGEVLTHGETAWLVEPGNAAALAEGIGALLKDRNLREKLGRNAREEVGRHYSWKIHTQKILDCLQTLRS